jgi:hypothetical protein
MAFLNVETLASKVEIFKLSSLFLALTDLYLDSIEASSSLELSESSSASESI